MSALLVSGRHIIHPCSAPSPNLPGAQESIACLVQYALPPTLATCLLKATKGLSSAQILLFLSSYPILVHRNPRYTKDSKLILPSFTHHSPSRAAFRGFHKVQGVDFSGLLICVFGLGSRLRLCVISAFNTTPLSSLTLALALGLDSSIRGPMIYTYSKVSHALDLLFLKPGY
jgi:hypothetical protein